MASCSVMSARTSSSSGSATSRRSTTAWAARALAAVLTTAAVAAGQSARTTSATRRNSCPSRTRTGSVAARSNLSDAFSQASSNSSGTEPYRLAPRANFSGFPRWETTQRIGDGFTNVSRRRSPAAWRRSAFAAESTTCTPTLPPSSTRQG